MTPTENSTLRASTNGHAPEGHAPRFSSNGHEANGAQSMASTMQGVSDAHELTFTKLRQLTRIFMAQVRARWWAGALAALLVGAGLPWLLLRGPTESIAETTLLAQSSLDKILNYGEAQLAEQRQENMLRNHTAVMASNTFLQRLAASFSAAEASAILTPYLKPGTVADEKSLATLLAAKIDVAREHGRDFFVVQARHYNPSISLLLANRFAEKYIGFVQNEYRDNGRAGLGVLEQQAATLTEAIRKLEDQRREYRQTLGFISVEENQSVIGERLRRINVALSEVRIQRVNLETQLHEAKSAAASPTPFNNPVLASFRNNQSLLIELSRLQSEREVLAAQYGPNHPKMVEVDRTAAALRKNLEQNFQLALTDLQSKVDVALSSEKQLGDEVTAAFNQSLELDRLAGRFNTLGEELAAKTKAQAGLLQHIAQTDVAVQMPASTLRVIDSAYLVKNSLRRRLLLAACLTLGGLAFFAVPLTLHFFDGTLSASTDLERLLGKDLLGAIPRVRKIPIKNRPHIVRDDLDPKIVDSFLGIVDRIEFLSGTSSSKSILVTSTLPAEGKSMFAANLASAFARIGRRTVLVDFDLRRASQQTIHDVPAGKGLLAWPADLPFSDNLLAPEGTLGLTKLRDGSYLLPAGGTDDQPSRLLAGARIGLLFQRLRTEFEVVLVDTPPAGVFQDALLLTKFCSGTILLGREGVAHTSQVERLVREFDKTNAPAIGLVLNAFSSHAPHPSMAYRHMGAKYGYRKNGRGKKPDRPFSSTTHSSS
jgi:polysaccharide biosynthesis transport protein